MTGNEPYRFTSANAYDQYVGRWSRQVAASFLPWLKVAPGAAWLDVGSGTGILTESILDLCAPSRVVGIDRSTAYVARAQARLTDPRVEFRVGDAAEAGVESAAFDACVAGLVLNFVPSPDQATQAMRQAVREGGIVAAYVWDYGGEMQMMRAFWDAAAAVDPAAAEQDAGGRFAICRPENLRALYGAAGLTEIETTALDVETRFMDFDDYWLPFLAAQGSVAQYLTGASEATRDAIRERLLLDLPIAADGSITLTARAWAVKGVRAG